MYPKHWGTKQTEVVINSLLVSLLHVMQKNLTMPQSMTHDLIDLYMFIITSMTFPVIPYENNFFHNVALLIESNALL